MKERKKAAADLRKYYTVFLQLGLLVTLLLFIALVKLDLTSLGPEVYVMDEQEVIEMEEIIRTEHIETPPPPLRPPVPVEVPNDEIIDDIDILLNSELSLDGPLSLPPPPPSADSDDDEEIFMIVEHEPELIGGIQGLHSHLRYPDLMRRAGIEGRVFVQFVVNEQGKVENPQIVRGLHDLADAEVIRVLLQHAEFTPGLQRGRPVKVQYSLQIVFRLEN